MLVRLALVVTALTFAAGCGDSDTTDGATTPPAAAVPQTAPEGATSSTQREMRAVVRAWSTRLNAGDLAGIAGLFRLPAYVAQGQTTYRLMTREDVRLWHSGLPCSGHIVSIEIDGRFATAVFRLGHGKRARCEAPGTLAAARFEIVRSKIRSWEQIPVPASDPPAQAA